MGKKGAHSHYIKVQEIQIHAYRNVRDEGRMAERVAVAVCFARHSMRPARVVAMVTWQVSKGKELLAQSLLAVPPLPVSFRSWRSSRRQL